jgi:hypothetical protein
VAPIQGYWLRESTAVAIESNLREAISFVISIQNADFERLAVRMVVERGWLQITHYSSFAQAADYGVQLTADLRSLLR